MTHALYLICVYILAAMEKQVKGALTSLLRKITRKWARQFSYGTWGTWGKSSEGSGRKIVGDDLHMETSVNLGTVGCATSTI